MYNFKLRNERGTAYDGEKCLNMAISNVLELETLELEWVKKLELGSYCQINILILVKLRVKIFSGLLLLYKFRNPSKKKSTGAKWKRCSVITIACHVFSMFPCQHSESTYLIILPPS